MPNQLANLLLPSHRPDVAPSARDAKNIGPRPDSKSDSFAKTLDRQLDRQQPAKDISQNKAIEKPQKSAETSPKSLSSKNNIDDGNSASTSNVAYGNALEVEETNSKVIEYDLVVGENDSTLGVEDAVDTDIAIAEEILANATAPNAALTATLNTRAATRAEATGLSPSVNKPTGVEGAAGIPVVDDTGPETALKETITGKSAPQKSPALNPSSDLFTKELAALNTEPASKTIFEEAKAQLIQQSNDTKANKNSGGLLQKAISEISGINNAPQNGLTNGAPNPTANAILPAGAGASEAILAASQSLEELSITPQNVHAIATKSGTAIQSNQSAQAPINSVAIQIVKQINLGVNRFQIRMDPPELGRIDVKVEFGQDGRMSANLVVERPETLDLLLRDARALERALAGSGLNTDKDSLSFSLKDQSGDDNADLKQDAETGAKNTGKPEEDSEITAPLNNIITAYRNLISSTAIDIRI